MDKVTAAGAATPQSRDQLVQERCTALLQALKSMSLDEGEAIIEWLSMKIHRVNAIIMDNSIDLSGFPRIRG